MPQASTSSEASESVAAEGPSSKRDAGKRVEDLQKTVVGLNERLDQLEAKITGFNDKLEAARVTVEHLVQVQRAKPVMVSSHPADVYGIEPGSKSLKVDPDAGFVNDEPVQAYRKAMMLFKARKYPEAVLAFSTFLEKNPDHPLAGSAQYYVGRSYVEQKEYKLALDEFSRILTSYDRSIHVAYTLRDMADAEDQLRRPEDAMKHRELLATLFPQSPAVVLKKTGPATTPDAPAGATAPPTAASPGGAQTATQGPTPDASTPTVPPPTAPAAGAESGAQP